MLKRSTRKKPNAALRKDFWKRFVIPGGGVLVSADRMKRLIYAEDDAALIRTLSRGSAKDGYQTMQKLQILFPKPVLARLRAQARLEDRPVSEIVRRAVERHLDQFSDPRAKRVPFKIQQFHGGEMLVSAERMKDVLYADDDEKYPGRAFEDAEKPRYEHSRLRTQRRRR